MQVKYRTADDKWLCFKHAVQRAIVNQDIFTETDEDNFCSEFDLRDTSCVDCKESKD